MKSSLSISHLILLLLLRSVISLAPSVVTGAGGFLGRAIIGELLDEGEVSDGGVCALVRASAVSAEQAHWDGTFGSGSVQVLPYDMLDGGGSLSAALRSFPGCILYHAASSFGPSEDHVQRALDNVRGTEDAMRAASECDVGRVVFTSSMAAVRGTGQPPKNGRHYTADDWNTVSELGTNWGSSYQYSKMRSEQRARELAEELGVELSAVCPAFVFGPPSAGSSSSSFSLSLVRSWMKGKGPVQSRLASDVRDVAAAHVRAGRRAVAAGRRYIVSSEARVPSKQIARALADSVEKFGDGTYDAENIMWDAEFDGGAIKIGDKEVDCAQVLEEDLGIVCRQTAESFRDMARAVLIEEAGI